MGFLLLQSAQEESQGEVSCDNNWGDPRQWLKGKFLVPLPGKVLIEPSQAPGALSVGSKGNAEVVKGLLEHRGMKRIVGFTDGELKVLSEPAASRLTQNRTQIPCGHLHQSFVTFRWISWGAWPQMEV